MNKFVESLSRLYKENKIDKKKLNSLLSSKKINQTEYNYILKQKEDSV